MAVHRRSSLWSHAFVWLTLVCAATSSLDEHSVEEPNPKPWASFWSELAAARPADQAGAPSSSFSLSLLPAVPWLCAGFLLYSSWTAVIQSKGDPATLFFVAASLVILSLLYVTMKNFEVAVSDPSPGRHGAKKGQLKLAIWVQAMSLNALFSYRVTSVLGSPAMSALVWVIASATSAAGCYLLFFPPAGGSAEPSQIWALEEPEPH